MEEYTNCYQSVTGNENQENNITIKLTKCTKALYSLDSCSERKLKTVLVLMCVVGDYTHTLITATVSLLLRMDSTLRRILHHPQSAIFP